MIDLWKKYGIFIKRKDRSKWNKLFRKIEKFKKKFQCQQSQIEQESMQNRIKMVLVKQLLNQLKRQSKLKKSKANFRKKQKIFLKKFKKNLNAALGVREKAIKKLNAFKKQTTIKKRKSLGKSIKRSKRGSTATATSKVSTTRKTRKDNTILKDYNRMMREAGVKFDAKEATEHLREKIKKDKESLESINEKIVSAINDINEMDYIIEHIKKSGTYDHFRLKPFMDYAYWIKPPKPRKATLIMDRVQKGHKVKLVLEDILDLKRKFIFDNIPECKVQMFDYLKKKK